MNSFLEPKKTFFYKSVEKIFHNLQIYTQDSEHPPVNSIVMLIGSAWE